MIQEDNRVDNSADQDWHGTIMTARVEGWISIIADWTIQPVRRKISNAHTETGENIHVISM
jgi:hypothetical protein